ncbi:Vacuolar protein sorting-associated protein 8 [Diplonema papillatum]|nr:Vacuolar protein sorting-associated protein 8 [Diplonema papillatum]
MSDDADDELLLAQILGTGRGGGSASQSPPARGSAAGREHQPQDADDALLEDILSGRLESLDRKDRSSGTPPGRATPAARGKTPPSQPAARVGGTLLTPTTTPPTTPGREATRTPSVRDVLPERPATTKPAPRQAKLRRTAADEEDEDLLAEIMGTARPRVAAPPAAKPAAPACTEEELLESILKESPKAQATKPASPEPPIAETAAGTQEQQQQQQERDPNNGQSARTEDLDPPKSPASDAQNGKATRPSRTPSPARSNASSGAGRKQSFEAARTSSSPIRVDSEDLNDTATSAASTAARAPSHDKPEPAKGSDLQKTESKGKETPTPLHGKDSAGNGWFSRLKTGKQDEKKDDKKDASGMFRLSKVLPFGAKPAEPPQEPPEPPQPAAAAVSPLEKHATPAAPPQKHADPPPQQQQQQPQQPQQPPGKGKDGWGFVTAKMETEDGCARRASSVQDGNSLEAERRLLQQILEDMEGDDVSTPADSELGLNDDVLDVDTVLKHAEKLAQTRKTAKGAGGSAPSVIPFSAASDQRIIRISNFQDVSTELNLRKHTVGWPTCLSVAQAAGRDASPGPSGLAYAVGTSGGVILLFTSAGKRVGLVGGSGSEDGTERGGCTCVDLFSTGEALVAGFQAGEVVIFDTASNAPLKSVKDSPAPLHTVKWLGTEPTKVATLDINGQARLVSLKKVPGLQKKFMTQSIAVAPSDTDRGTPNGFFGIDAVSVLPPRAQENSIDPVCVLAVVSRAVLHLLKVRGKASQDKLGDPFYQYDNPHFVREKSAAKEKDVGVEPVATPERRKGASAARNAGSKRREQLLGEERRKREKLRQARAEALPVLSWLARDRDPELAVLWHDHLAVFKLSSVAALEGSPKASLVANMTLRHGAVAGVFVAPRAVVVIDTKFAVLIVDPHITGTDNPVVDIADIPLEPVFAPAGGESHNHSLKSFSQAVRPLVTSSTGHLLALSKAPVRLNKVDVLAWRERLQILSPDRASLELAQDMLCDKAHAVVGLPSLASSRERALNEEIERLVKSFMRDKVSRVPPGDADAWWRSVGSYAFGYCCKVRLPHLIFSVLYEHFARANLVSIWVALLEPCILRDTVTGVPEKYLELVCAWLTKGAILAFHHGPQVECGSRERVVDFPYSSINNPHTFTVEAWVWARGVDGSDQCPVSSVDMSSTTGWAFILTKDGWTFQAGDGSDWTILSYTKPRQVTSGWTRLTAVHEFGDMSFFIDEELAGRAQSSYQPNMKYPLRIGGCLKETAPGSGVVECVMVFKGDVKDVSVYSSVHNPFSADLMPQELDEEEDPVTSPVHADRSDRDADEKAAGSAADIRIADVKSAVSDEASTVDMADQLAQQSNGKRLENILLHLEPRGTAEAGGKFSAVLAVAEKWHLYRAFTAYHNRATSDGYRAPLALLYARQASPMEGSIVEHAAFCGQPGAKRGAVKYIEDQLLVVRWFRTSEPSPQPGGEAPDENDVSSGSESPDAAEKRSTAAAIEEEVLEKEEMTRETPHSVAVVPESPPNKKARTVLLDYLRHIFKGRTFYGASIPKEKLLEVKVQAMDFLFMDDGSDREVFYKGYPILQDLLWSSGPQVFSALNEAFNDESPLFSPWKVVRKLNAKPVVLYDVPNPEKHFRLSRDEVAAILLVKMNAGEFKAFEPQKTYAREWPSQADMVALYVLLAESIHREVIKTNKDMVKRIVAHLAHDCPKSEARAMQKRLENVLKVAFHPDRGCWPVPPTEEETAQLRKVAQEAGFMMLQIYLYKREANYHAVLHTYLLSYESDDDLQQPIAEEDDMFNVLEETLEGMKGDPSMIEHQQKLQEAILENLEKLVKIDSNKAAGLVVRHLRFKHAEISTRLDKDKKTQFAYLKGLIDASSNKEETPAGLFDAATVEKYIKLLCLYDEANILPFLREHEDVIKIARVLKVIEQTQAEPSWNASGGDSGGGKENAVVYLYSRTGRSEDALDLIFKRLQAKMQHVRTRLCELIKGRESSTMTPGWSFSMDASASPFSPGMGRRRSTSKGAQRRSSAGYASDDHSRSFHRVHSDGSVPVATQEVLSTREGKAVSELIDLGIDLCSDVMRSGAQADTSGIWFSLLDKFIQPKKILSEVEAESRGLLKHEAIVAAALAAAVACVPKKILNTPVADDPARPRGLVPASSSDDEVLIDELAEVEARSKDRPTAAVVTSGQAVFRRRAPAGGSKKLLSRSLSPLHMTVVLRMQEMYSHYITQILMRMMAMHNAQAQSSKDDELYELRKKVEKARLMTVGMPRRHESHQLYEEALEELTSKTKRIEMMVLQKIIKEHSDSTFSEFKTVLIGILENAKFEQSLQKAFHSCLAADMHNLEKRQLQAANSAACPRAAGLPPWAPKCAVCKARCNENGSCVIFTCGHVFHNACFTGKDGELLEKCFLCYGRSKSAAAAPAAAGGQAPPKGAEGPAAKLDKVLTTRLSRLSDRLSHKRMPELLATLHGGDTVAAAVAASGNFGTRGLNLRAVPMSTYDDDDDVSESDADLVEKFFIEPPELPEESENVGELEFECLGDAVIADF